MTPTEQDKELRAYIAERFGMDKHEDWYDSYRYNDRVKLLNYITADRKRVALEARINEVQNAYEYWINGRRFISSYFRDRIALLSNTKEGKDE